MTRDDRSDALHALAEIGTYLERLEDALDPIPPGYRPPTITGILANLAQQVEHLRHLIARQGVTP